MSMQIPVGAVCLSGCLILNINTLSLAFRPSSQQTFSEEYVESKRCGRTLVALILGMNVAQAARHGMIDESLLPANSLSGETSTRSDEDESLFVSEDEGQFQMDVSVARASDSEQDDNISVSSEFLSSRNNHKGETLDTQSEQTFNGRNLATPPVHQALNTEATVPAVMQQPHRLSATAPAFNFLQDQAVSAGAVPTVCKISVMRL